MKSEHRLGRFYMDVDIFRNEWIDQLPIMGNFVVVETRFRYDLRVTEYLAYSPLFDAIKDYESAPTYDIEIAMFPNAPAVIKAHRRKD